MIIILTAVYFELTSHHCLWSVRTMNNEIMIMFAVYFRNVS